MHFLVVHNVAVCSSSAVATVCSSCEHAECACHAGQKMSDAFELLTRTLQDLVGTEAKLNQVEQLLISLDINRHFMHDVAAQHGLR